MGRFGRRWRMVVDMVVLRDALVLSFFLVCMAVVLLFCFQCTARCYIVSLAVLRLSWFLGFHLR